MEPNAILYNKDKLADIKSTIYSVLIVIVGSILMSVSIACFLNPLKLYAAGVTGIAQIFLRAFGIMLYDDVQALDKWLGLLNFIFLLPFDVLAYFKLSKKYGIYSLISSVVQTIVLLFEDFLQSFHLFGAGTDSVDTLACVFMAGLLSGVANGIIMKRGGTSGGITILCQYINIKKNKSVGMINLIISILIMLGGATISFFDATSIGSIGIAISIALYTLLFFIMSSLVLDYIHTAYNKIKLEVVTTKGKEMSEALLECLPHGITVSTGYGAYTKENKDILNILIHSYEVAKYIQLIKSIDDHAFILSIPVSGFSGKFQVQIINK